MAHGNLLHKLIKSGVQGDQDTFLEASEEVIKEERNKQHHLLANDLERILYGTSQKQARELHVLKNIPTDRERGLPLVAVKEPVRTIEDAVFSDENKSLLDKILLEHHREELLKSHGLRPADKLLFFGPPGCGKTITAELIASDLSRLLAVVRIESVVSSYLGETAANLRTVFDFIESVPLVVLFDEFDAIARERSDASEHGELKRVVNSVLQMFDSYAGKSLLIAATNHDGVLDSAIWRRFDEILFFDLPNQEQIKRLLEVKLRGVWRDFSDDNQQIAVMFKGLAYADIERILIRAIKEMVLQGKEFLTERHIENAIRGEEARNIRRDPE